MKLISKDLDVTVRVRNNQLLERRQKLGLTQREFADVVGTPYLMISSLETLKTSPFADSGICRHPSCAQKGISSKRGLCPSHATVRDDGSWPLKLVWSKSVLKISEYYDVLPEVLFPDAILSVKNPVVTRKLNAPELAGLVSEHQENRMLTPDSSVEIQERDSRIRDALEILTPRERELLKMRFGLEGEEPVTLREASQKIGRDGNGQVSPTMLGYMEAKALRKLHWRGRLRIFVDS